MKSVEKSPFVRELDLEEINQLRLTTLAKAALQAKKMAILKEDVLIFGGAITGKDISIPQDKHLPDIDICLKTSNYTSPIANKFSLFQKNFILILNESKQYKNPITAEQVHNFLELAMLKKIDLFRYGYYLSIGEEVEIIRR